MAGAYDPAPPIDGPAVCEYCGVRLYWRHIGEGGIGEDKGKPWYFYVARRGTKPNPMRCLKAPKPQNVHEAIPRCSVGASSL